MEWYIYVIIGFCIGLLIGIIALFVTSSKLKKEIRSLEGLLDSERLKKETAQKENHFLIQSADAALITTKEKLQKTLFLNKQMDSDILLLQKSNEETEALLAKGEPALHDLKLKLIEAQNMISRYKAQLGEK